MGTVNRFSSDPSTMANLRLLCVILVLAVVCYEANAYTYWDCANFSKTLSCGHKHISIANVWYGRRYKTVFFGAWSKNSWKNGKCRNGARHYVDTNCHGKNKCHITGKLAMGVKPGHKPDYFGCYKIYASCVEIRYYCK